MRVLYLVVLLLLLVPGLTGCTSKSLIAQRDREIAARDQEISELQREITELENATSRANARADELNADLQRTLGDLQEKEKLWLQERDGMSEIIMPNTATFASGSTQLTSEGKTIIDRIWEVLDRYPDRAILIEGHTDDVPIAPAFRERFETNWELSAARALAVLHYVRDEHNASPQRLAAVGCGEYRPVAQNASEQGRAKNRRVVIKVGNQEELAANE